MCFLLLYYNPVPSENQIKLIFAHNRDEYFDRPSQPASYLDKNSEIICGRDLTKAGTWLGICKKTGSLATVLNIPDSRLNFKKSATTIESRGLLCLNYLENSYSLNHLLNFEKTLLKYNNSRFLLILIKDLTHYPLVYYYNNLCGKELLKLNPGIYTFGNSQFPEVSLIKEANIADSLVCSVEPAKPPKWKKLARAKEIFAKILDDFEMINLSDEQLSTLTTQLMNELLRDKTKNLPDPLYESELGKEYGFGDEELHQKSSIFVEPFKPLIDSSKPTNPKNNRWYGTRCMSVIIVGSNNEVTFTESCLNIPKDVNTLPIPPDKWTTTKHRFKLG